MQLVTSHERADMDALASIYAATLLYPDSQAVLPQKLNRNLRDFLALYKDEFPFIARDALPHRRISRLILVDTQAIAPIRGMDAQTVVQIIDHHPLERELPENGVYEGDIVGATTTLLVEKLRALSLAPSRLGASLLLLGIYEDTGALTYLTTTTRDAEATAWILAQGADLALVSEFLNRPLSNGQRDALAMLIRESALSTVRGRTICIAAIALDRYVDELSTLVHQLVDLYEPDACFVLAQFGPSTQIIARSTTHAINVAELLRVFGGGGHSKAAAALVEENDLDALVRRLRALLEEQIEPPVPVREIMSTSVHTLSLGMSVRDAAQLMGRYGHEGFPVVEEGRLLGVITRRDIDRALHHRLGDMPVRNFLHVGPLAVRPQDSIDEVQRVMIEHDLGQVPVVEDGQFVGIVTRTDLIKLWSAPSQVSRAQEIRRLMDEALPDGLRATLLKARDVANALGYSLFIVGGFVRDLLLGAPTLDLDLVVEGDAIRMAKQLAAQCNWRVRSHARFGTAKVIIDGERAPGAPPSLDLITARTEFYERPTALPHVEQSSIKQDLYRRDFTINTMAICLDRDRYGELLDYYGGERDIRERRIRVLHNLSFVEDPTRILRAVRFEQRLGFVIEARTEELIADALDLLDHVTGERIRHELYLILAEDRPELCLDRLSRLGALTHIDPRLTFSREMPTLFQRLRARFREWPRAANQDDDQSAEQEAPARVENADRSDGEEETGSQQVNAPRLALGYLALLTSAMSADDLAAFADHLRISRDDAHFINEVSRLRIAIAPLSARVMLPSAIYRLLNPFSREARFVLSVLTEADLVRQRLDLYERELAQVTPRIDGYYLKSLGVPPGPIYGEILERVLDALLDKQVTTLEEECAFARRLVEAAHENRPPS